MEIYNYKEYQIVVDYNSIFIPFINVRIDGNDLNQAYKLIDVHESKAFISTFTLGKQSLVSVLIDGETL